MARTKTETAPAAVDTQVDEGTVAQAAETEAAAPQERKRVEMVLQGAHQISAEVASDEDARPPRKGRTGSKMDDELQAVFDQHVAISWERDSKWIAIQVPIEAERECIKRLRYAAEKAGLGLSVGNVRPDPTNPENIVRIPFQARKRKVYKPREGKTSAE